MHKSKRVKLGKERTARSGAKGIKGNRLAKRADSSSIESLVRLPTKVKTIMQSRFLLSSGKKQSGKKSSGSLEQTVAVLEISNQPAKAYLEPFVLFEFSYAKTSPSSKHKYEDVPVVKVYLDAEMPFLHVRYGKALWDIRKVIHYNKRPAGWDYSWYDFMTKEKQMGKKLAQVAYNLAQGAWKALKGSANALSSYGSVYLYGWGRGGYSWTI